MSKEKVQEQEQQAQQPAAEATATAPGNSVAGNDYPKTLTAATREDLFAEVEKLKTSAKDVTLSAGAVARNEQGQYVIQIDIIN